VSERPQLLGVPVVAAALPDQGLVLTCLGSYLERVCENHDPDQAGQDPEEAVVPVGHQRDWPAEKRMGWAQHAQDLLLVVEQAVADQDWRQRQRGRGPAWAC